MSSNITKPNNLTAQYQENPESSTLTQPYDLQAVYDENAGGEQYDYTIDTVLDTSFGFEVVAVFSENTDVVGQIDTVLDTSFIFEIEAVFSENLCTIDTILDTTFQFQIDAVFDINHIVGVSYAFDATYQEALPALLESHVKYSKSIFKAQNRAFVFDRGLTISNAVTDQFEKTQVLHRAVKTVFEQATGLNQDYRVVWQENDKRFIARTLVFEESEKLLINRQTDWQEMIRKRKQITFSHEVAHVFEKRFTFEWDKGLEFITTDSIDWDVARPVYYRKSEIKPFPPVPIPEYVGSTDLNFVCLCHDVDAHNVILNFGVDDCIPAIPNQNWWYIVNEIEVSRLDNGQKIHVFNGSYRTDRSSWCWSYNLTIPALELSKLDPIAGQPVILKIVVNGYQHLMLLENRTRSRQFASETYTLTGRSVSALLDAPSSPPRAFLQENERTSVQLVQAEIDRSAYPDLTLNWQLIDALGWIVPTESFSYSGSTPVKAIQEIAAAGGGFVYSEADSQAITIKPLYKKTYWDPIAVAEYDILLPESIVTEQSTDYEVYPDYNGITLTNDKTGLTGQIKRTGTSGNVLYESVNNRLFTSDQVMGGYGKSKLAKAGLVESHTFSMPLTGEIGQCKPADILAFNAEFWGVVDSVSVSFTYSKVRQSVTVERVNNE
ncbi:hypothetical protein [Acinetobacter sp.]|uniref:hypothetical protein n=1 Tax=Acinetobacter sp. TaxID=472 RepID=UPI0028ABFD90|nr:hypothetical protein [Acinetobacter sp.]